MPVWTSSPVPFCSEQVQRILWGRSNGLRWPQGPDKRRECLECNSRPAFRVLHFTSLSLRVPAVVMVVAPGTCWGNSCPALRQTTALDIKHRTTDTILTGWPYFCVGPHAQIRAMSALLSQTVSASACNRQAQVTIHTHIYGLPHNARHDVGLHKKYCFLPDRLF